MNDTLRAKERAGVALVERDPAARHVQPRFPQRKELEKVSPRRAYEKNIDRLIAVGCHSRMVARRGWIVQSRRVVALRGWQKCSFAGLFACERAGSRKKGC
jgi:hypothetical protein